MNSFCERSGIIISNADWRWWSRPLKLQVAKESSAGRWGIVSLWPRVDFFIRKGFTSESLWICQLRKVNLCFMTVLLRTFPSIVFHNHNLRTTSLLSKSLYQKATPLTKVAMNSTTASYDNTAGSSPKQMGFIQELKLNDGNQIPMVIICP